MNLKLIIAGSRTITDAALVERCIEHGLTVLGLEVDDCCAVVCGMAGREGEPPSVDRIGKAWAEKVGLVVIEMPADWKKHGKSAGHIRNNAMADVADALIAIQFAHRQTPGTTGMIAAMRKRRKAYVMVSPDEEMRTRRRGAVAYG